MIAAVVAFLALAPTMHASAGVSSQEALLSPHVHPGQTLTYFATVTNYPAHWMRCEGGCHPDSHSLVIACSIGSTERGSISLERRVRAFLQTQVGPILEHPPIVMRAGRAFRPDGSALNMDPICPIYSTDLWGVAPPLLHVGTAWRFQRNSAFNYRAGMRGTVTVRNIDADTGAVSLHVATAEAYSSDIVVSKGGIVLSETERWHGSPFDEVAVSTLQEHSLAGLWRIPPTEPVPFGQTSVPDVFNPNGRFISIWTLPLGDHSVTLVRIWHFGPFSPASVFGFLTAPKLSDWLLFCGVALLVVLVSRAEFMVVQMSRAGENAIARVGGRRLLLEIVLGLAIATACMLWVYR